MRVLPWGNGEFVHFEESLIWPEECCGLAWRVAESDKKDWTTCGESLMIHMYYVVSFCPPQGGVWIKSKAGELSGYRSQVILANMAIRIVHRQSPL